MELDKFLTQVCTGPRDHQDERQKEMKMFVILKSKCESEQSDRAYKATADALAAPNAETLRTRIKEVALTTYKENEHKKRTRELKSDNRNNNQKQQKKSKQAKNDRGGPLTPKTNTPKKHGKKSTPSTPTAHKANQKKNATNDVGSNQKPRAKKSTPTKGRNNHGSRTNAWNSARKKQNGKASPKRWTK